MLEAYQKLYDTVSNSSPPIILAEHLTAFQIHYKVLMDTFLGLAY